jgi:CubicO group peptidase (beta-lactamase class C family)
MTPRRSRLLRRVAVALGIGGLLVAVACWYYPADYVWRVLVWQDADADDHTRFPMRRIAPRPGAEPLIRNPQRGAVEAAWKVAGGELPMRHQLEELGTQAFLVVRRGEVIYEDYYDGITRDSWVTSFSIAKSFLSVLVGIAVSEGAIASIDDPVTKYLPELRARDPRFDQVRLRHLLRMASGIRYNEFPFLQGDDAKTYYHPDLRQLALRETRIETPPGRHFHYNNFHPLLLGMVLERATKMPVAKYLETRLWQPAGMVGEASWSLDSERAGFEKMESGLNARAEDFARFGLLMLREGRIDGKQVVPVAWVAQSTGPDSVAPPGVYYAGSRWTARSPRRYYAAMWWGETRGDGGHDFAARGNHGQFIFVSPRNDVVIVRHGTRYGLDAGLWFERARLMADALGENAGGSRP